MNSHGILYLHTTPSKFFIHPSNDEEVAIWLDRETGQIGERHGFSVGQLPANTTSRLIYGIVGIKRLIRGLYLIVITKASTVGQIDGHDIYRMDHADVIPFLPSKATYNPSEGAAVEWNDIYVGMLDSVLKTPSFYFSYSYDLTNSLSRLNNIDKTKTLPGGPIGQDLFYHDRFDKRFLWNNHLMADFHSNRLEVFSRYHLPLIHGFVYINNSAMGYGLNWALISRRSVFRAGTRFNSRGIDQDGHVSNFVETEQIVEDRTGIKASFVQIRGSIPLLWSQKPDYSYKPIIDIAPHHDQDLPIQKHFEELKRYYCNVSVVSLIDSGGHEGDLGLEYGQNMANLQNFHHIPYHYFDFHKECSKMRWHRLSILMDKIRGEIDLYGYFAVSRDSILCHQTGVIRVNCIDSLDRTNVVQSMIAKYVLEKQMSLFTPYPPGSTIDENTRFMQVFKNAWADNADVLSIQYAGTPALKTDFTRTGKRTQAGLMKDGLNSLTRYVTNNFFDDYRQDAIDLFLGKYEDWPSPLYQPRELVRYLWYLPTPYKLWSLGLVIVVFFYIYLRSN